jgi:hypothetical protein
MNRTQFTDTIRKFYDQGLELIASKNDDYAGDGDPFANFRMAEKMGLTTEQGIMLRLLDKVARLANVHKKGVATVASESLDDTLLDLANYTAILYAYRQSQYSVVGTGYYHTNTVNNGTSTDHSAT